MILLLAFGKRSVARGLGDMLSFLEQRRESAALVHLGENLSRLDAIDCQPSHVGLSVHAENSGLLRPLIARIRKRWPAAEIILGGWHINEDSLAADPTLGNLAEFCVIGEGEYATLTILGGAEPGVYHGKPLTQADFDLLPLPTRDFSERYYAGDHGRVLLSRGCPFQCAFCHSRRGGIVRRAPDVAVRHLADVHSWTGRQIFVLDDVFTADVRWLREFAAEVKRQGHYTPLRVFAHGRLFDGERAELLEASGVVKVSIGAESGDDEVLAINGKGTTVQAYRNIDEIMKHTKMQFHCLWMLGLMGDTAETITATLDLAREIGDARPNFGFALPFPGTRFWREHKGYGRLINPDWSTWSTREPAFVPMGIELADLTRAMVDARRIPAGRFYVLRNSDGS